VVRWPWDFDIPKRGFRSNGRVHEVKNSQQIDNEQRYSTSPIWINMNDRFCTFRLTSDVEKRQQHVRSALLNIDSRNNRESATNQRVNDACFIVAASAPELVLKGTLELTSERTTPVSVNRSCRVTTTSNQTAQCTVCIQTIGDYAV